MLRFRRWLGEHAEERLVVYHGTNKDFAQFDFRPGKRFVLWHALEVVAKGFFFSEDARTAAKYGRRVIRAAVTVNHLLLDPRADKHLGVDPLPPAKHADLLKILKPLVKEHPDHGPTIEVNLRTWGVMDDDWVYHFVDRGGLAWEALDEPGVVDAMLALGYDGTFVSEEGGRERSLFVPRREQIEVLGVE